MSAVSADNVGPSTATSVPATDENAEEADVVTLTLNDVLELENEMMEDAAAVLGAANDKNCSYSEGYVKRQALYSCLTCLPEAKNDANKGAGICLACSYHCHEGHELVELYTKRNFRCDCGNSKFNGVKCNLYNSKSEINEFNVYNQNFCGLYCDCHRPYPDPEDSLPDEMIQCIICEDWYHSRHLDVEVPSNSFEEMICGSCVGKHEFLLHYNELTVKNQKSAGDEDETVNVEVEEATSSNKPTDVVESVCKKSSVKSDKTGATFFPDISWRKQLCSCSNCLKLYEDGNVSFLIDSEDPVHYYEEKGKAKAREAVETQGRDFINSMDRFQLGEVVAGYNDLKENLAEYLKKFADNKTVVKEEDIKEFFDGMKARKKQKVDIPYFCH